MKPARVVVLFTVTSTWGVDKQVEAPVDDRLAKTTDPVIGVLTDHRQQISSRVGSTLRAAA